MLGKDVKKEPLGNGIFVLTSKVHRFGTDASLLAGFSSPSVKESACDLCTGCGIIPMLWLRDGRSSHMCGVELQHDGAELARRSVEINGAEDRIEIVEGDLKTLRHSNEFGPFDVVTANPPYKPVGTGIISGSDGEKITRHEVACTIYDVAEAASRLLKYGGRFCVCHRPERLCDVLEAMRLAGIEPKRLRFVVQHRGGEPWLVLVEGRKGGKKGLRVQSELVIQNENGEYTEEVRKMYGGFCDAR